LWSVEFTLDKAGRYHTHLHILAFRRKFFDVKLLRSLWKEITGDSHVLRLDKITETIAGTKEVLKYAVKPLSVSQLTPENLRDFVKMRKVRLIGTFGKFRDFCAQFETLAIENAFTLSTDLESFNRDLVEGCACPYCEAPLFEVRMFGNDLPGFLRSVELSAVVHSKSPPV
jgi:hypothetical protein